MRPANIKECWDDNDIWMKARLIAYNQIRDYEDQERDNTLYRMLGARVTKRRG